VVNEELLALLSLELLTLNFYNCVHAFFIVKLGYLRWASDLLSALTRAHDGLNRVQNY
jgi:hypothetical protein